MYTIEILSQIETPSGLVYNVGQYDVTKEELIELTGESLEDFKMQYCSVRGGILKDVFNSSQVDIYIL